MADREWIDLIEAELRKEKAKRQLAEGLLRYVLLLDTRGGTRSEWSALTHKIHEALHG